MWRLLIIVFALLPAVLQAQTIRPSEGMASVDHAVWYLEDSSGEMSIDAVRAADANGEFNRHQEEGAANFGLSSSAWWLRFTLAGDRLETQRYLLEVGFYALTDVQLFHPDGRVVKTGAHQPAAQRPWPHHHLVFPIHLTTAKEQTYYLRVSSVGSVTVPLTLWTAEAFANQTQIKYLWTASYYGGAFALLLFNFFLFVSLRDRNYLLYCSFLFFTASGMFIMNGFGAYALAPIGWPENIGTNTFFSLSGFFAVWFLRVFLDTRRYLPGTDKLLQILMAAFLFIAANPLLDVPVRIGVGLLSTLGVIAGPILIFVTLVSWWRGHPGARYLLLAWTVLLVATSVQSARNFGLIPTNFLTSNLLQIGSLLDMLLLSFALADRIQAERMAKEAAQQKALEAQTQLVEGLKESERRLERTVQQRTRSLESALRRERETLDQYVEFGALIAHEFRNPLAIITNQAQLAQLEEENAQQPPSPRLKTIMRASERLQVLFDQWLQSDRLKDNIEALEAETLDLSTWLPEMLAPGNIRITHPLVLDDRPLKISADEALLATALHNLIDNAAKYSPPEAPIEVTVRQQDHWVGIAVTDRGPGIPDSEQKLIFKKHHRAANNSSRRGLGLGLYFVSEVMKAHDGAVSVESEPGEGSTFILWLPRADAD